MRSPIFTWKGESLQFAKITLTAPSKSISNTPPNIIANYIESEPSPIRVVQLIIDN